METWVLRSKETIVIFFFVAHYVHISLFAFVSGCSSVNAQPNNPQLLGTNLFPFHTSSVFQGLKKIRSGTRTLRGFV